MSSISVIVPVYKVEKYLDRCVKSILAQTYTDFELILVDDGSPDACPQMCDDYEKQDRRIHVIHQKNGGLSAARNAGLDWLYANSQSQWITFIDSDDWVHPTYLESLLDAVKEFNSQVSMCQLLVTENYQIQDISDMKRKAELWNIETAHETEELDPNSSCARLYHRNLFQEIRFPVGKLHEDRFTTYKLLFQSKQIPVISAPLYYYYVNTEGIVHGNWNLRKLDDLEATEQQLKFFKENGWIRTYIYTLRDYIHLLVYSLRNMKNHKEFKKEYHEVQKKLKKVLKDHHDLLGMTFEKDFNTYKYAYPFVAKVYRRLMNLKR